VQRSRRARPRFARWGSGAILVRIQGSHFLWKMVRRIVGVLAAIGRGDLGQIDALAFLETDKSIRGVTPAALTAPAAGLFLEGVYYKGDDGPRELRPVIQLE
jgi:tRNA pseudouridine38-40 synthase